jgi:hypothetical protein
MSYVRTEKDFDHVTHLREQIEQIAENQEVLAEARETLLVERSTLRSHSKRVNTQRVRTGNAEVEFMNALRVFYHENGLALPPALLVAYEKVQEERDKLGSIEAEYFQAEEALGGKEWEFMDQENDFYQYELQDLFSHPMFDDAGTTARTQPHEQCSEPTLPQTLVEYQATKSRHAQLLKELDALRHEQAERFNSSQASHREVTNAKSDTSDDSSFTTEYKALLMQAAECEVQVRRLRQDLMNQAMPATTILSPNPEATHIGNLPPQLPFQRTPKDLLDGAKPDSLYGLPIRDRLPEWMLDYLKGSALERLRFLNILEDQMDLFQVPHYDYTSWEDSATQFWLSDSSGQPTESENEPQFSAPKSSPVLDQDIEECQSGSVQHSSPGNHSVPKTEPGRLSEARARSKDASLPTHVETWLSHLEDGPVDVASSDRAQPHLSRVGALEHFSRKHEDSLPVSGSIVTVLSTKERWSGIPPSIRVEDAPSEMATSQRLIDDGKSQGSAYQGDDSNVSEGDHASPVHDAGNDGQSHNPHLPGNSHLEVPSSLRCDSCQDSDAEIPACVSSLPEPMDKSDEQDKDQKATLAAVNFVGPGLPLAASSTFTNSLRITAMDPLGKSEEACALGSVLAETETDIGTSFVHTACNADRIGSGHAESCTKSDSPVVNDACLSPLDAQAQPPSRTHSASGRSSRPRKSDPGQLQIPAIPQHKKRSKSASAIYFKGIEFQVVRLMNNNTTPEWRQWRKR